MLSSTIADLVLILAFNMGTLSGLSHTSDLEVGTTTLPCCSTFSGFDQCSRSQGQHKQNQFGPLIIMKCMMLKQFDL